MCRILIVEDEILVAMETEAVALELGHSCIGIAADRRSALALGPSADIALVDVNLLDGRSGPAIGEELARRHGVLVLFMTANPGQLGGGVPGTLGVLAKPVDDRELRQVIAYLAELQQRRPPQSPPARLRLFSQSVAA